MGRTRRSFTKEFKREAVHLITDSGQSIAKVARDLGIRDTILGRWKNVRLFPTFFPYILRPFPSFLSVPLKF